MKKILLLMMAFVSLQGWAQLSEEATFDIQKPAQLRPTGVTPSTNDGGYVNISNYTFQDQKISLSFGRDNIYGIAELYTRVVSGMPTQYYIGFSQNANMKIKAESGCYINRIVFTGSKYELAVNEGTFDFDTNTWTAASSSGSSEVIFSHPNKSAEPQIMSVKVYYTAPSEIMEATKAEIIDKDGVSVKTYSTTATEVPEVRSFKSLNITFPYNISSLNLGAVTMTDANNQAVSITPSCAGNVLSIAVATPITEDGDYSISVPQRVVRYGDIQNKTLPVYQFKVRKDRAIFNYTKVNPAEGNVTSLPQVIKLGFSKDTKLITDNKKPVKMYKDGEPQYSITLSVDEAHKDTVLLDNNHGLIDNSEANLGVWTIVIPDSLIHNPFQVDGIIDNDDYWNAATTLTWTMIETPDPLKDQKAEVEALKQDAADLKAKIGTVGYPKEDDATNPLATAINFEISAATTADDLETYKTNLEKAIKAFYNATDIVLPISQKWYTIASVNKDNDEVPLSYASEAVTLGGTATAFQVESITSDGVAVLKVKAGKDSQDQTIYKYLHVLLGADDYDLTSTKNVTDEKKWFSSLTIGKMVLAGDDVDQKPVAGLLTIKGGVGNDKTSGEKLGEAYAQVTHGATPTITTSLTDNVLYFESGKTTAFRFVETDEPSDEPVTPPASAVSPKAMFAGSVLDSNTKALTLIISGKANEGDITNVSLATPTAPYFVVKNADDSEGSQVTTFTGTTILEKLEDGTHNNYFKVNVNGLADGSYYLILPVGTFAYTENVTDERMRADFTIDSSSTPTDPTTPTDSFTKNFLFYSWPNLSGDTPVVDVTLNDVYVYIRKGQRYSDMYVDTEKTIELIDGWNDNIKYREGHFVEYPGFALPEEYGGADPTLKAYRIQWNPEINAGDFSKPFLARVVIPEATLGNEVFGQYKNGESVNPVDCIVNKRVSLTFKINNEGAALNESLVAATAYYDSILDSYPSIAAELKSAINAAKLVLLDSSSSASDLISAKQTLDEALQTAKGAVTGISTLSVDDAAGKVIYDLQGRRVQNMDKKGIYIVNGRKVVIK